MIRLDDNLEEIRRIRVELSRCKTKGPHYRDLSKRLRKLRYERAEALRHMRKK